MKIDTARIIASTLHEHGVVPLTWTPALGVTEIMDAYNEISTVSSLYSFNEETAYTIAHGGAMYGSFAASIIKTHGLLKAANTVSDSLFVELDGAMVLVVIDDRDGIRSDSIIFADRVLPGLEMPFVVSRADTVRSDILKSFEHSKSMGIPFAVVIDTVEVLNKKAEYNGTKAAVFQNRPFSRCPQRKILFPKQTRYQRKVLDSRLAGEKVPELPPLPMIPDDIPPYWHPAIERYTPMMNALNSQKTEKTFITTDIGFYASFSFPPFEIQDVCTFMGCAISLAVGAVQAGCEDAWAVVGDFTFIAAGHLVLLDPGILELPVKVVLIDNGMAETTGRQAIPEDSLKRALNLVPGRIVHVHEPFDEKICNSALKETGASRQGIQVVVFHFPVKSVSD